MRKSCSVLAIAVLAAGFASGIYAGGMIDTLGDFKTYPIELEEDTAVMVGETEIVLQRDSGASYYVINGVQTEHLYKGRLAQDAAVSAHGKKVTVRAPNIVWFYDNGELKYTSDISEPTLFTAQGREVMFSDSYDVYLPLGFHRNGHIYQASLYEPTKFMIQDSTFLFKGRVNFAENGNLTFGVFAEDGTVIIQEREYAVPAGDYVLLYDDGTVKKVILTDVPARFKAAGHSITFTDVPMISSTVSFYPNGSVMSGCLAEDTVVQENGVNVTLNARTLVIFNEDGTLYREK